MSQKMETFLTIITTVITNASSLPIAIYCYKFGYYYETIIGISTFIASTLYHCFEVVGFEGSNRLFGMNAGQWHRLDNLFIILAFQCLVHNLLVPLKRYTKDGYNEDFEIFKWLCFILTVICQEFGPWNIMMTIVPIIIPFIILLIRFFMYPKQRCTYDYKFLNFGFFWMSIAIFFFIRGLDDKNDWLRLNHGLWHLFAGIAWYCFIFSVKNFSNVKME